MRICKLVQLLDYASRLCASRICASRFYASKLYASRFCARGFFGVWLRGRILSLNFAACGAILD